MNRLPLFLFFSYAISINLPSTHHRRQLDWPDATECPENWSFELLSYHGPGCPDSSPTYNRTGYSHTYPTWGSHAVPGCHTPWAWFQFPWMQASTKPVPAGLEAVENSTWCEMVVKYTEMKGSFAPYPVQKGKEKFRMVLGRNGSSVEAEYSLDEGTRAEWKIGYYTVVGQQSAQNEILDEININGPVINGTKTASRLDFSSEVKKGATWAPAQCGHTTFGMRVELKVVPEREEAKGLVVSRRVKYNEEMWIGAVVGLSHDFEPCAP